MKKTVCVMFGGRSSEYEVSLHSASSVLRNINRDLFNVLTIGVTKDGQWYLYKGDVEDVENGRWCRNSENIEKIFLNPSYHGSGFVTESGTPLKIDVVFPVMHGANCEDGTLQGLFDIAGIKYVGSGCTASAVAMDKSITKAVLNNYGIRQARAVTVTQYELTKDFDIIAGKVEKLNYPVFVKPASAGSSVGVCKVFGKDELYDAIKNAVVYGGKALVEEYIKGREIEVAVIGNDNPRASCPGEIDPGAVFYDYDTKYNNNTAALYIPARLDEETAEKVKNLAVEIYRYVGCRGFSRVDFFVTKDNEICFNEINTIPGFTSISMFPKLFMNSGMTYTEIITELINLA